MADSELLFGRSLAKTASGRMYGRGGWTGVCYGRGGKTFSMT